MTGESVIKAPLGVNSIPNRARSRSVVARPPWLAGAPLAEVHSRAGASNPACDQISRPSTSAKGSPVTRSASHDSTNVLAPAYS